MIKITIPKQELFDEIENKFIDVKETEICLEHSLVSISKWEAKWHKPFLDKKDKTREETLDYIRCMILTQNIDPGIVNYLSDKNYSEINAYINDSNTATFFNEIGDKKRNNEIITSELIYYWMVALQIPFECQKWHLNRLLTLIRVCNVKNSPDKKLKKNEILNRNRALNEARKQKLHTRG